MLLFPAALAAGQRTGGPVLAYEVSTKLTSWSFQGKENISPLKTSLAFAFPFLPA